MMPVIGCTYRRFARPVVVAALVAILHGAAAGQQVELRRKYEVGSEHVYRTTVSTSLSGGPVSQTQDMVSVVRERVDSVAEDGTASVSMTTEQLKMTMDGPMGRVEYDSQSGVTPTGPFAAVAEALAKEVGRVRAIRYARDGAMLSMEGMPGLQGADMRFPEGPIRIGAEWDHEATVKLPDNISINGSVQTSNHFHLREIAQEGGRSLAVIDVTSTGTMQADPSSAAGSMLGSMPIESTGEIYFDIERGLVIRSVQRQKMTMTLMGESMQTYSENVTELIPPPGS
jgi:hypothetical protein